MTSPLIRPELPVFKARPRQVPEVKCDQFMFRQSFIQDYLKCPQYAMRRWVANIEEGEPFMAAILGTAGHEVIYRIHKERRQKADVDIMWISSVFEEAFYKEVEKIGKQPKLTGGHTKLPDCLAENLPFYVDIIRKYQTHPKNATFYCMGQEQSFVLPIRNSDPSKPDYLFTGQIDQHGLEDDGQPCIRDIKFRDGAFKYSRRELDLNIQLTTYAAALRYGLPSCTECAPRYDTQYSEDGLSIERKLVYNGPCAACESMIGTPKWPNKFPVRCYMVWMYDLEGRGKDEFPREIDDPNAPKVYNPETKRYRKATRINPEWEKGAKKGDPKGECFLMTYRSPGQIQAFMENILMICDDIRSGTIYRRPSDNCNYCTLYNDCKDARSIEISKQSDEIAKMYASDDPFASEETF